MIIAGRPHAQGPLVEQRPLRRLGEEGRILVGGNFENGFVVIGKLEQSCFLLWQLCSGSAVMTIVCTRCLPKTSSASAAAATGTRRTFSSTRPDRFFVININNLKLFIIISFLYL